MALAANNRLRACRIHAVHEGLVRLALMDFLCLIHGGVKMRGFIEHNVTFSFIGLRAFTVYPSLWSRSQYREIHSLLVAFKSAGWVHVHESEAQVGLSSKHATDPTLNLAPRACSRTIPDVSISYLDLFVDFQMDGNRGASTKLVVCTIV